MHKLEQMLEDAVNKWRENKCVGAFIMPNPIDSRPMILSILQKRYARYPSAKTLLVVDSWDTRC